MRTLGIITVPKRKSSFYKRYLKPAKIIDTFEENNKFIIAEIQLNEEQIKLTSAARVKKVVKYAKKLLYNNNVTDVLFADDCKGILLDKVKEFKYDIKKSNKIPPLKLLDAFCYCMRKNDVLSYACHLHIKDEGLSFVTFNILEEICTSVKRITLHSQNLDEAEKISKKLFSEYGLLIEIANETDKKKFSHMIDFDKSIVRVADFVINGAEFISDCTRYPIDASEEAACLGEENKLIIKNWLSNGTRLKIS